LHEINQEVEDLRFEGDRLAAPPQLAAVDVKYVFGKDELHVPASPAPSGSGLLDKLSSRPWIYVQGVFEGSVRFLESLLRSLAGPRRPPA